MDKMHRVPDAHRTPDEWADVFFRIAFAAASRSKDPSTQCGAVLVSPDNVLLATGFNGPPQQILDDMVPWDTRPDKYAFVMHSEENALWYAAGGHGFDKIKHSTMYCTHHPCTECVLRMIRCGVRHCYIPLSHAAVALSKYQIDPEALIRAQAFPKMEIEKLRFPKETV